MRDFVKICLTKDHHERPTVDELLKHPFMAKMDYEKSKSSYMAMLKKYHENSNQLESLFSLSDTH